MVTLQTANSALKDVYAGVIANQINMNASPFLSKINRTNKDIFGKEIIKLAPFGINGGIACGDETGDLPVPGGNQYAQMKLSLKNMFGQIQISDKAMKCSQNSVGSFVNLLANEMQGLVESSQYNLGRMIYGDSSGLVGKVKSVNKLGKYLELHDPIKCIVPGMLLDVYFQNAKVSTHPILCKGIDRVKNRLYFDNNSNTTEIAIESCLYPQNGFNNELTGLGRIFSVENSLYGLTKSSYPFMQTYIYWPNSQFEIDDTIIQEILDHLDEDSNAKTNYIACSSQVRRTYQQYLNAYRKNVDIATLDNGVKTITYNGIPFVSEKFIEDDTMYLLNTNDFTFYELDDWRWIEDEEGRVIRQIPGKAAYSATLVKYGEIMCERPSAQAMIRNIKGSVVNPFINTPASTTPEV